jgi:AcrR family transcriptional regulator
MFGVESNTKALIFNGYLELIEKADYNKITVTDIAEYCDVSRQTFYYHFESIEKMIIWAFDKQAKKINYASLNGSNQDYLDAYTAFIKNNSAFIKNALQSDGFLFVYNSLYKVFYDTILFYLTQVQKKANPLDDKTNTLLKFCIYSIIGQIIDSAENSDGELEVDVATPLSLIFNFSNSN